MLLSLKTGGSFNEVLGVQQLLQGKVIRLRRCPFPEDTHESETALDPDKFNWEQFDAVIPNDILNLDDTKDLVWEIVERWYKEYLELQQ